MYEAAPKRFVNGARVHSASQVAAATAERRFGNPAIQRQMRTLQVAREARVLLRAYKASPSYKARQPSRTQHCCGPQGLQRARNNGTPLNKAALAAFAAELNGDGTDRTLTDSSDGDDDSVSAADVPTVALRLRPRDGDEDGLSTERTERIGFGSTRSRPPSMRGRSLEMATGSDADEHPTKLLERAQEITTAWPGDPRRSQEIPTASPPPKLRAGERLELRRDGGSALKRDALVSRREGLSSKRDGRHVTISPLATPAAPPVPQKIR